MRIEYVSNRVRMTRMESKHRNLRTDVVEGHLLHPIKLGERIVVTSEPLNSDADIRIVRTTEVLKIEGDLYYTLNSIYKIEHLASGESEAYENSSAE